MQSEQILLKPLTKLYGQVQNIFWTQPFGLSQISFCFTLFIGLRELSFVFVRYHEDL
jgi:hypothetical protein